MYSGTTFRRDSGRIIGVHQRIDRLARKNLQKYLEPDMKFPKISEILYFEGKNGPDGLKLKSPLVDEYEHEINPIDVNDRKLVDIMNNHIVNLSKSLKRKDMIRASFEAAWLAHAIVDGMTPAHHFPDNDVDGQNLSSEKLAKLKKVLSPKEDSKKSAFLEKWGSWGSGGVLAHVLFELGVASVVASNGFSINDLGVEDTIRLEKDGFETIFLRNVGHVYELGMYKEFLQKGWTRKLANQTKKELLPLIIKTVCLGWYQAILLSREEK